MIQTRLAFRLTLCAGLVVLAQCRMPGGGESVAAPAKPGVSSAFVVTKTAKKFPPAPESWSVPLTVVGGPGFTRGGVPFPPGHLQPKTSLRLDDGSPVATEPLGYWPDGSVKWLLVEAANPGREVTLLPGAPPAAGPVTSPSSVLSEVMVTVDGRPLDWTTAKWAEERVTPLTHRIFATGKTAGGLLWRARFESRLGAPEHYLRFELRNPTPTTEERGQPTCMTLGCVGTMPIAQVNVKSPRGCAVMYAEESGAKSTGDGVALFPKPMELRPGEQFGWEIVIGGPADPEPYFASSANWSSASGAIGPLVPMNMDLFSDYEANSIVGAQGIRANRARPHWRNPRDAGEDQRDWDGGVLETDFQTHNNEYEVLLTYAKQHLRTSGLHSVSGDWRYLGVTCSRHFANVDIYHIHEGPLPFMHGAAFQHTRHGGSGQGDQHRSSYAPNMAHQTARGLLAWYYLTGDPLLLESFLEVAENTRWRVMNGPGMPGISGTGGEERGPAMALGLLTDAWQHTGDPKWFEAAKKVVDESHAKTKAYVVAPQEEWKAKPWMLSLLVVTLDEFQEAAALFGLSSEAMSAKESAGLYKTFLSRNVRPGPDMPHLPYQVSNDPKLEVDESRDSWSVVAADALVDFYPDTAFALFRAGSRTIWYPGHPVGQYAKLLNHTILSGWGHRTMAAIVAQGKAAPDSSEAAAVPSPSPNALSGAKTP